MEALMEDVAPQQHVIQRRRTAYACVSCRSRKSRCDGHDPCSMCQKLAIDCHYDHAIASTKGKSDLILNAMLRLEASISNIDRKVSGLQHEVTTFTRQQSASYVSPTFADATPGQLSNSSAHDLNDSTSREGAHTDHDFNNATISPDHISTTEAILHWPTFDAFPELRHEDVLKSGAIFWMENTRERQMAREPVMPFLSEDELDRLVMAFQRTTNSFYPIVTQKALDELRDQYHAREMDFSTKTCFILLVMALGCAAEVIAELYGSSSTDKRRLVRLRNLGRIFFDAATCRLHAAYCMISTESIQCLALTALYYAYLQRPIQAWAMLSSTATACRVMKAYNPSNSDDTECIRRIFWMCYILESDYLAELPALPQFGIAEIESSVPLPGSFISHEDTAQNELVSLYFVGCISMRRLLNRCHHLLFGERTNTTQSRQGLAAVVAELDQQLEDWKRLLPPSLSFTIDTEPAGSQHSGFLRQRFLTCRALIYRTYLMEAVSQHSVDKTLDRDTVKGARRCLEASLLHILNLRPFDQTVLVDVWICSLSMAGTMMVLLAAASIAPLRHCLVEQVYTVGAHLKDLLESCLDIHGESPSPSVRQAIEWIKIIDKIIQRDYGVHDRSASSPFLHR